MKNLVSRGRFPGVPIYLRLFVAYACISQILSIFRVVGLYNTSVIANYALLVVVIIGLLFSISVIRDKRKMSAVTVLLLSGLGVSALIGLICNGPSRNYLSELLLTFSCIFLMQAQSSKPSDLSEYLDYAASVLLWCNLFFVFLMVVFPLIGFSAKTTGVNSIFSLFPLVYYLVKKRKVRLVLSLVVVLYCGKRGVLLSAAVVAAIFFILEKPSIRVSSTIGLCAVVGILGFAIWSTSSLENVENIYVDQRAYSIAYRIHRINPLAEDNFGNDLGLTTGGRSDEIEAAIDQIDGGAILLITGTGIGYEYTVEGEELHNTHVSIVMFVIRYGILFTAIFYLNIVRALAKGFASSRRGNNEPILVMSLYSLGSLLFSFTAFTLLSDLLFISFVGILLNSERSGSFVLNDAAKVGGYAE